MKPQEFAKCCGPIDGWLDTQLFKALADPTRLKLFSCLARCGRPCSVTELAECCDVDFSVVSRHLATLERAGILAVVKQGRAAFYEVRYSQLAEFFRGLAKSIDSCRSKRMHGCRK
jgi:DNA-binding transcriptional ArsR family regulator